MNEFTISKLSRRFPSNDACLEEIKRLRYPHGIKCRRCQKVTKHYKLKNRTAYSCEYCRNQVYPLNGTIFEKSSTPLRTWFYAMYLMTYTWGQISAKQLEKELGVTYKTAWRISRDLKILMSQNNADLLSESKKVFSWSILNAIEFKVVQKKKFINENQ
jgi:transposase